RRIERLVAVGNPQESGALLERLLAEPRHLQEILAALERSVLVAEADDILRDRRRETRDAREERARCGVDVHADRVHAVLDPRIERARKPRLIDVVLILTDADRLR